MPWQFENMEAGKETPPRETFKEAFEDMFLYVTGLLASGNAAWQVLETTIWIKPPNGDPWDWYDSRDWAIQVGVMDELKKKYLQ